MKKLILFASLIIFSSFSVSMAGSSFRCGPNIVSVGDSKSEVLGKCGEPTSSEVIGDQVSGGWTSRTRDRATGDRSTSRTRGTYTERSSVLESWNYNCGPSEFSHTLTFQGQNLVEIKNIGYGYGESDCIGREQRIIRKQPEAVGGQPQRPNSGQGNSPTARTGQPLSNGSISVQGSPAGAKVYIDGSYVSNIPCILYDINSGTHTIEVQDQGYKSRKEWVKVKAGEVTPAIIDLERQ